MVTAILPSLTDDTGPASGETPKPPSNRGRPSVTLSVDSEVTITPEYFRNSARALPPHEDEPVSASSNTGKPSALAGYVGLFTGCGALVALSLFLPLPARFSHIEGVTLAQAVQYSYYVVGAVSLTVAIFVFLGLRNLRGEEGKGLRMLFNLSHPSTTTSSSRQHNPKKTIPYWTLLKSSLHLPLTDSDIALGYLGGFVARASTVAISLFLPLAINTFFIRNGFCHGSPTDPSPELKKECRQAYILASILSGVAQLVGLVCAPLFGYLSARKGKVNWPVVVAAVLGMVGYLAFPRLPSPEYRDVDGRGGSVVVFLLVALMGVSQIGAIVCSLGSLGRGVLKVERVEGVAVRGVVAARLDGDQETLVESEGGGVNYDDDEDVEDAPLLRGGAVPAEEDDEVVVSRVRLKGSVAGVYSWCGGAAILLLTKLGGYLFDTWSTGAPFYLMAGFNGILLLASIGIDVGRAARARSRRAD